MSAKTRDPKIPKLTLDPELRDALKVFYDTAAAAGFKRIDIAFSGSGDEGFLNGVDLTEPDLPLPQEWAQTPEDLAERVLEAHGGDYANGEGGQGSVQFHIENRSVYVEFEQNYTETRNCDRKTKL